MRKDDSAQLILIAGFTIGIAIVISTIMLNNIIYASNMASESSADASRIETSNIIHTTSQATSAAYQNASNNNSFNYTAFNDYMASYNEIASQTYALSGISFSVENSTFFDAYFTQSGLRGGNPNWTVVENSNSTDVFLIEITNTSSLGTKSDAFEIRAINNSDTCLWSIKLYDDSGSIGFNVTSVSGNIEDSASAILDIENNEIDNSPFSPGFYFNPSTYNQTYDLKFFKGNNAAGCIEISGGLENNESFTWKRYEMTNATVIISSNDMETNMSIPISLP